MNFNYILRNILGTISNWVFIVDTGEKGRGLDTEPAVGLSILVKRRGLIVIVHFVLPSAGMPHSCVAYRGAAACGWMFIGICRRKLIPCAAFDGIS